jgi:endonuclease-3
LYKRYDSINKLARARYVDVAKVIRGVNYYKTKAKHIISCAKMIVKNYKGKIPHDFAKLVELPGVGRKTANVFLAEKGHAAIGVDTHLLYCAQRLGWSKNKSPNKVEEDLKKIFPKSYWGRINYIVVRFGQSYRSKREKNALLDKIKKI